MSKSIKKIGKTFTKVMGFDLLKEGLREVTGVNAQREAAEAEHRRNIEAAKRAEQAALDQGRAAALSAEMADARDKLADELKRQPEDAATVDLDIGAGAQAASTVRKRRRYVGDAGGSITL